MLTTEVGLVVAALVVGVLCSLTRQWAAVGAMAVVLVSLSLLIASN